jgi:hypothetical protein
MLHGYGCTRSAATSQDAFTYHKHISQNPEKYLGQYTHDPIVLAEIHEFALDVQR